MELRTLQYFLAIAQFGNMSTAAEALHMTQPPLSRQLKMLEEEVGAPLFYREKEGMVLTPKGETLRQYAQNILRLTSQAEKELGSDQEEIGGDVYLGSAETCAVYSLFGVMRELRREHPRFRFHVRSGNALELLTKLDEGALDFCVVYEPTDTVNYHCLKLPDRDCWGVLMRKDSPLAEKEAVSPQDLWEQPLIVSIQTLQQKDLASWMHREISELNIAATYNLMFNAGLMVRQGLGYALVVNELMQYPDKSPLCYRSLTPTVPIGLELVWRKHIPLSPAAQYFLEAVQNSKL